MTDQPRLFPEPPRPLSWAERAKHKRPEFSGETFDSEQDGPRLGKQLAAVRALMLDGQWRTLPEIREHVKGMEAALSARLRDLRNKHRYTVEKRQRSPGLYEYRVTKGGE